LQQILQLYNHLKSVRQVDILNVLGSANEDVTIKILPSASGFTIGQNSAIIADT
jgi:hypothetical protein